MRIFESSQNSAEGPVTTNGHEWTRMHTDFTEGRKGKKGVVKADILILP
jgi:hypothetical protein